MNSLAPQPAKSYIATEIFTNYFYTYSVIEGNGIWGQVTSDDSACPRGRILRENGKKLFPKANPGVDTYYVGVYDSKTFLNGFIDPNEKVFQVFSDEKPGYLDDCGDSGTTCSEADQDLGEPVYTRGNITTTEGSILVEGQNDSGGIYCTSGSNSVVYAGYSNYGPPLGNVMAFAYGQFDTPFIGSVCYPNAAVLSGYDGAVYTTGLYYPLNSVGTSGALTSNNPSGNQAATSGSIYNDFITDPAPFITLTRFAAGGTLGHLSYTVNTSNHTFTIFSDNHADTSTVNWLLIGNTDGSPPFFPYAAPGAAPASSTRPGVAKPGEKEFDPSKIFNLGRRHR
jgi:hypothetical protein